MTCLPTSYINLSQSDRLLDISVRSYNWEYQNLVTARKRSLGQGNIFTPACQSWTVTQGGYLTRYIPQDQVHYPQDLRYYLPATSVHPQLTRYTPHCDQAHPPGPGTPQLDQVHPQTRYYPPSSVHAGRYGQQAGGTHPTGMHSCLEMKSTKLREDNVCNCVCMSVCLWLGRGPSKGIRTPYGHVQMLFTMKHGLSEGGRLAFDLNAFFLTEMQLELMSKGYYCLQPQS